MQPDANLQILENKQLTNGSQMSVANSLALDN